MLLSALLLTAITAQHVDPVVVQANQFLRTLPVPTTTLLSNECGIEENGYRLFKGIDYKTNTTIVKFYCNKYGCHK